nr:hypothetical protein [Tanacetum cinerariifolium]
VKTINEDVRLQALVNGKKVIVNEASIRRDLRLNDAEGTACLPNAAIFEELARIGKQRKEAEVPHTEPQTEEHIPTPSHDPLPSGEDRVQLNELMEICTKLSDSVLSLEQINTNQAAKIEKLKKRVKKLKGKKKKRNHGPKRLYKGRIAEIDVDEDLSLINETAQYQGRMNDQDIFGINDLDGDEVVVDVLAEEKEQQSEKVAKKEAQSLIVIKAAKPKALITAATTVTVVSTRPKEKGIIMQDPFETPSPKPIVSSQQPSQPKDKGKAKMVKPKRPLKRKEQIMIDEQIARDLEA